MASVMNTAAVSGGYVAAVTVIVQTAALFHVTIDATYAGAIVALVAPLVHWISTKYNVPDVLDATPVVEKAVG